MGKGVWAKGCWKMIVCRKVCGKGVRKDVGKGVWGKGRLESHMGTGGVKGVKEMCGGNGCG